MSSGRRYDVTETYGGYSVWNQICFDFVDDALDIYYGFNWSLKPYWAMDARSLAVGGICPELRTDLEAFEAERTGRWASTPEERAALNDKLNASVGGRTGVWAQRQP